jgi:hypothetical protein
MIRGLAQQARILQLAQRQPEHLAACAPILRAKYVEHLADGRRAVAVLPDQLGRSVEMVHFLIA